MGGARWPEIEQWFLTAADLPRAEQSRFLEAHCPEELRGEVAALLEHDGCGDALLKAIVSRAGQQAGRR